MDKYDYMCAYGCLWESMRFMVINRGPMRVYGVLWESMDKYEYMGVYESMSIEIYGCLWTFMDKYENGSVYRSLCVSMGVYRCKT